MEFDVTIEIPKGSRNKYEVDHVSGRIRLDRTLFTANANFYFNDLALKDYADSLGPLGAPQSFTPAGTSLRGGMTERTYEVKYPTKNLTIIIYEMPDGKFEQYLISER